MINNDELAAEIARQGERLGAQLAEHARELEAHRVEEGRVLVQEAREAVERLLRDLNEHD
jgi:polyhydroxyalkanoate synthesis regulator phasin